MEKTETNKNKDKDYITKIEVAISQENQVGIKIDPNTSFMEAMQLYATLGLHILNAYYHVLETSIKQDLTKEQLDKIPNKVHNQVKEKTKTKKNKTTFNADKFLETSIKNAKESMYDVFNTAVSNVLTTFSPDKEMRPDLTYEAIIEKENELLEKQYKENKETQEQ